MNHELKCWVEYFGDVQTGAKPFEVRKNDRNYSVGDTLRMREWDHVADRFTGVECQRIVSYVLPAARFPAGIQEGYVVLGLLTPEPGEAQAQQEMQRQRAADAQQPNLAPARTLEEETSFRNVIEHLCTISFQDFDVRNPLDTIAKLIAWEQSVALTPSVSLEARELMGQGADMFHLMKRMEEQHWSIYPSFEESEVSHWNVAQENPDGTKSPIVRGGTVDIAVANAMLVSMADDEPF